MASRCMAGAIGCGTWLVACQRDYQFDTTAHYQAPVGRYELFVHAAGVVRAGADVSNASSAEVRIAPLPSAPGGEIRMRITLPRPAPSDPNVADLLRQHGYSGTDEESAEVQRAIEGALAGPKGTLMEGQSKALRVIEVKFSRP
jgi:hypothetical protein